MSRSKKPVSINILSTLDSIELVRLSESNDIAGSGSVSFAFDHTTREILDLDEFKNAIKTLYESNGVPLNSPTNLILPSYLTREFDVSSGSSSGEDNAELALTPEEMQFALISEAEKFHIFKVRNVEPLVSYYQINASKVIYSAYPTVEIEKIILAFDELNIPLLNIDLNYFSILRGLLPTGYITEETEGNLPWCLMVVSDTTLFLMLLEGLTIVRTSEAPLSVNSEDTSATLSEITHDFNAFTGFDSIQKLVIVNNAIQIKSSVLSEQLTVPGVVEVVEQNPATLVSRGASEGFPCSLEALGGTVLNQFDGLPFVDFKPAGYEDAASVLELRKKLLLGLGGVAVLCLLVVGLVWGSLFLLKSAKEQEVKSITEEATKVNLVDNPQKHNELVTKLFIKRQENNNIAINDALVYLGQLASSDTWYTSIVINRPTEIDEMTPYKVVVEGNSLSSPDQVDKIRQEFSQKTGRTDMEVKSVTPDISPEGQNFFKWMIQSVDSPSGEATN